MTSQRLAGFRRSISDTGFDCRQFAGEAAFNGFKSTSNCACTLIQAGLCASQIVSNACSKCFALTCECFACLACSVRNAAFDLCKTRCDCICAFTEAFFSSSEVGGEISTEALAETVERFTSLGSFCGQNACSFCDFLTQRASNDTCTLFKRAANVVDADGERLFHGLCAFFDNASLAFECAGNDIAAVFNRIVQVCSALRKNIAVILKGLAERSSAVSQRLTDCSCTTFNGLLMSIKNVGKGTVMIVQNGTEAACAFLNTLNVIRECRFECIAACADRFADRL